MRRYWYSIFLICSIVIMATANMSPSRHTPQPSAQEYVQVSPAVKAGKDTPAESQGQNETISNMPSSLETTDTEAATHMAEQDQKRDKYVVNKNFSDTLFIGDSRTVGLSEYGDLGQAVVFANSGMSVFNLLDAQVALANGDKQKLDQVLSERNFKAIYLMLGINELGYEYHSIVRRYQEVVDWIREKQPDATLILEANLHVTEEKSAKSDIYNNQRINALNNAIRDIAEDTGCLYIDVNPIFDDGNGNLSAVYSTDGAHVLGKYYSVWVDLIRGS